MPGQTNRREFVRSGLWIAGSAAAGALMPGIWRSWSGGLSRQAVADEPAGRIEKRLRELGIELPAPPQPVAVYVPAVRVGNTLYTSGHGPRQPDGRSILGKVGGDLTLEQGREAARLVGLNVLSTVHATLGSLDHVVRLVKVLGMVNCTPDFTQQPQVINGFSELIVEVFGETAGKGARSAVGMGSLPGNIAVEIEAVFEVRG